MSHSKKKKKALRQVKSRDCVPARFKNTSHSSEEIPIPSVRAVLFRIKALGFSRGETFALKKRRNEAVNHAYRDRKEAREGDSDILRRRDKKKNLHGLELNHLSFPAAHIHAEKHKNPSAQKCQQHIHVDPTRERRRDQKRGRTEFAVSV